MGLRNRLMFMVLAISLTSLYLLYNLSNRTVTYQQNSERIDNIDIKNDHDDSLYSRQHKRRKSSSALFTDPLRLTQLGVLPCQAPAFLVILVVSSPSNRQWRDAIRQSWAANGIFEHPHRPNLWRIIFVTGKSTSLSVNEQLKDEAKRYVDMIIGDFTFVNNKYSTYATMLGLKWAHIYCRPKFIVKTIDNTFVNVFALFNDLVNRKHARSIYQGRVDNYAENDFTMVENIYDTPIQGYSSILYCHSNGYLMSGDILTKLVSAERTNKIASYPNVHDDGIYVGLLLSHYNEVVPRHDQRFDVIDSMIKVLSIPLRSCSLKRTLLYHKLQQINDHRHYHLAAQFASSYPYCYCLSWIDWCFRSDSWFILFIYFAIPCTIGVVIHQKVIVKADRVYRTYRKIVAFIVDTFLIAAAKISTVFQQLNSVSSYAAISYNTGQCIQY